MKILTLSALMGALLTCQLLFSQENIVTEKKGENITHTNKQDVVAYSSHKNDKAFLQNLQKTYHGLGDEQKLNDLLKKQDYIEVLNYVWTEPDSAKRLAWLEKKANEGHPILMFELGEEYYTQNPTIATYANQGMPWIMAGVRRTLVDADCTSDQSVAAASEFLLSVYQERMLKDLKNKYSEKDLMDYLSQHLNEFIRNNTAILKKVMEPFVSSNAADMPAPNWVYQHGMGSFLSKENTITPEQCQAIRKKAAEEFLEQAQKAEQSITN